MPNSISASAHAAPTAGIAKVGLGAVLFVHLAILLLRIAATALLLSPLLIAWLIW